jgi:hypothetical protein
MTLRILRILLMMMVATGSVLAQCVMCNRTAAAQNLERARVLNLGIVVLLIPPFIILTGLVCFAYRRSKC